MGATVVIGHQTITVCPHKQSYTLLMHDQPDVQGLERTAYEQHGYFTTSQAREHGISSQLLSHYVRRNRFERVRRGLYHLPGFPRPEDDEMREKWMAVGVEKAVLSHQSALALLDLSDVISRRGPPAPRTPISRRSPSGRRRHPHPPRRGKDRHGLARRTPPDRPSANARRRSRGTAARAAGNGPAAGARPRAAHGAGTRRGGTRAWSPRRDKQRACGGDLVRYESAAAFRMALEQRLKTEAETTGFGLARLPAGRRFAADQRHRPRARRRRGGRDRRHRRGPAAPPR